MNPNRRFLAVSLLAFASLPGLGAQTVIDQLYGLRQYDLADAYYAAGQRFTDLGQADRGTEFKAKAKRLFPGYVPGQAPQVQALPASAPAAAPPASPAPQVPSAEVVREKNLQGEKIAKLQFQKLLRGYLTGNASTVTAVLAPTLSINGDSVTLDGATVETFLQAHPAEAGSPDELFILDSLAVADGTGSSVQLTVRAQAGSTADLAAILPFWKDTQVYTFDRVGDTWKLVSIAGK